MGGGGAHVAPAIPQQCWVPFSMPNKSLFLTTPQTRMSTALQSRCSTLEGPESSTCGWYTQISCNVPRHKYSPEVRCHSIYSSMMNGTSPAHFMVNRGEVAEGREHYMMRQEESRLACASFVNGGDSTWSGTKTKRTRRGRRGGKNRRRHQIVMSDEEYPIQPRSATNCVIKSSHEKSDEGGFSSAENHVWGCHFLFSSKPATTSQSFHDVSDDTGSGSCTSLASFMSSKGSSLHESGPAVSRTVGEWLVHPEMLSSCCASRIREKKEVESLEASSCFVTPQSLSTGLLECPMRPQNGDDGFNAPEQKKDVFSSVSGVWRTRFGTSEWQESRISRASEQSRHVEGHQRRAAAHLPDQKKRSNLLVQFANPPKVSLDDWFQEVVFAPFSLASSLFSPNNEAEELPRFFEKDNDWLPPRSCLA